MTKGPEVYSGVKIASSTNGVGDLDCYMQKNDTQLPIYTISKNKLKMDERVKYKSWYDKSPRREYKEEIFRYSRKQYFH